MTIQTPADFTGTGATVTLASLVANAPAPLWAKIIQVIADGGGCRIGDINTAVGRGSPILGSQFIPPISEHTEQLDLNTVYIYVPNGVVIHVMYFA